MVRLSLQVLLEPPEFPLGAKLWMGLLVHRAAVVAAAVILRVDCEARFRLKLHLLILVGRVQQQVGFRPSLTIELNLDCSLRL